MSSSHNDDQHSNETKPVAFTVPLIMASVLVFIIVMFLSLCDPKQHHAGADEHGAHNATTATSHDEAISTEKTEEASKMHAVEKDTVSAETTVPSAEPTKH
jgi:hypothetical protein